MNVLTRHDLPTPRVASRTFDESTWSEVLGHLSQVIGTEAEKYRTLPAARLVASIAYLSGSEDADRFAVSNVLTFHAATKARALFNHRVSDNHDVLRRLATLQFGHNADAATVECGMTLLALVSLSDHEHDVEADKAVGKYNPVLAGAWNASELRVDLLARLAETPALKRRFDEAVGLDVGTLSFWGV